jgi:hypothetical protein
MMVAKFKEAGFRDFFYNRDFRAVADIDINVSLIADKFGVTFVDTDEYSDGNTKIAYFITQKGTPFFIEEFPSKHRKSRTQIGLRSDEETLTNELEDVLEVLELSSENISWYSPKIEFELHELWRQDDNGHKFLIETFTCRADAVKAIKEFEPRLHKQTYWVEKVV